MKDSFSLISRGQTAALDVISSSVESGVWSLNELDGTSQQIIDINNGQELIRGKIVGVFLIS